MSKDKKAFGNFLRKMIKQAEISQATFYEAVEITKPYFYDILSGKANPPPPDVQYKIIDKLNLDNQQRNEFLNLAAEGRGEIPADIARLIADHPQELDKIRTTLTTLFAAQGYFLVPDAQFLRSGVALKYKSAQILQLETHARTCYNFYKISFIPLGTLVRYTDRKGGEAVEYSDRELVHGIKGGDKSALELLVRRWYPRIYGYVFKLTGHEQDAYDLTQDVFIAMMQSIGSYTPWRKFDSWLFTIAHNKCMDYFRFRQKIVQAEDTMFDRHDPAASLEDMAAVSLSVKAALEKLPAAQREAVILHYFHQFTASEIARMTNTPLPTVKSRLRAARNTLSDKLREDFE